MSKKGRLLEFILGLRALPQEEVYTLARLLGIKFMEIEVRDKDGELVEERIGDLKVNYTKEQLKEMGYSAQIKKKDGARIVEELVDEFDALSFGQQRDILSIVRASLNKSITEGQEKKEAQEDGLNTEN